MSGIGWNEGYGLYDNLTKAAQRLNYEIDTDSKIALVIAPQQLTIDELKNIKNEIKVGIFCDSMWCEKFVNLFRERIRFFDIILTSYKPDVENFIKYGGKRVYYSNSWVGVNEEIFKNLNLEQDIECGFIGNLYKSRRKFLRKLDELPVWHYRYFVRNKKPIDYTKEDRKKNTEEYVKIINRTKINFDFLSVNKFDTGRILEVLSCEQFLLKPFIDNSVFRNGEHLVEYKNAKDALEKAKYYLKHDKERKEIAQNGRKEILKNYTSVQKLQEIIDLI